MKKNFFKKLSFVLALAMIVTALAPATGVFAAAKPKLNASKVYIHVAEKTQEFDFNISNKKTGWKYTWKSSNEDVAEVASNGLVTAVGKGTATISVVIKDKKGKKVDTLKATVVVRDNIKKLTIKNAPAGDKLAVGATYDFNRSFVTASGNTKKTSGITRWEVDKTGATIVADSGVFTATEAGTYTITARAFQSKAKYTSWLSDSTKYASYVTATATYTVKVASSMTKVAQTDLDSFKVTFDSPVTDVAEKLSVVQVVNGTEVLVGIKGVSMSADNKEATVDMNNDFAEEYVYKVKYPEMDDVQFTAAKVDEKLVTDIAVTTTTVQENRGTDVDVALYNKDGVNIANATLLTRVELSLPENEANANISGRQITMYTKGKAVTVKATYHTYDYDVSGVEKGVITKSGTITCVAYADYTFTSIDAYSISKTEPDWVKVNHNIAVGDDSYKIWAKVKGKKWDGSDKTIKTNDTEISSLIKFESANKNVLVVDEITGQLYPVTTGSTQIIIKYNDTAVGAATVTVQAKRAVSQLSLSTNSLVLSNKINENHDVKLTVKDQFGDKLRYGTDYTVTCAASSVYSSAPSVSAATGTAGSTSDQGKVTVNAGVPGVAAGTYNYTFTVEDNNTHAKQNISFTVSVKTTSSKTVSYYRVEVGKNQYDMNLDLAAEDVEENVTFSVYGYAADGVKITKELLTTTPGAAGSHYVTLTKDGADKTSTTFTIPGSTSYSVTPYNAFSISGDTAEFKLVDTVAKTGSSLAVSKQAIGTYVVKFMETGATAGTNKLLHSATFSVVDTQSKPTFTVDKTQAVIADYTNPLAVVKECLNVVLDGVNVEGNIFDVDVTASSNNTWIINKIYVREYLNDAKSTWINHEVVVGRTVTSKSN
jgi:hypothetical protein